MSASRISIFGSHSGHNKGDVAILDSMIERFQREPDLERIIVPSKDTQYLQTVLETDGANLTPALTNYLDRRVVRYLRASDAVIIGGGGLIFDRRLFSLGYNHLTNIYLLTRLCDLLRVDYYLFSVGIDELTNPAARRMFRSVVGSAAGISVRDQHSMQETRKYTSEAVALCPDPALRLAPKRSERVEAVTDRWDATDRPTIGLFVNGSVRDHEERFVEAIRFLSDIYYIYVGQTRTDQSFAREIATAVGENCSEMFEKNHLNGHEHIALIQHFDRTVCVPMHSSIFSYLAGTPYLSVAYQLKVRSFNELVDNEFVLSLERVDQIPDLVEDLDDQNLRPKDELAEQVEDGFASVIASIRE